MNEFHVLDILGHLIDSNEDVAVDNELHVLCSSAESGYIRPGVASCVLNVPIGRTSSFGQYFIGVACVGGQEIVIVSTPTNRQERTTDSSKPSFKLIICVPLDVWELGVVAPAR